MKLGLCTIYYNSKRELERLMNSVQPRIIDKWIFIDGIFRYTKEQNPKLSSLSDDLSTELIKGSGYDVHVEEMPESNEFDKRNRYLELCQQYDIDYMLIVDSDEYFTYNDNCKCKDRKKDAWDEFKDQFYHCAVKYAGRQNVFNINMLEPAGNIQPRPRCWYNPGQMRYVFRSHYHWANLELDRVKLEQAKRDNKMWLQYSADTITKGDITLVNDPITMRTPNQLERRKRYQQYLVKYEGLIQGNHEYDTLKAHKLASQYPQADFIPL